jgi:hypothetical protein
MEKAEDRYQSAREMLLDLSFDKGDEILEAIERWLAWGHEYLKALPDDEKSQMW